ncbi:RNA-binding transcriptional accessory protein [Sporolactobacillus shoreae]|uniref:RNA-binding transcriptional accessory protein n=1 Tax=Sporolactobacillus shoreae TaxID=1465501 RepID=A0A4Z0GPE7_9BACL|nr:Tex family protein [Sporolactobacillus shoreae]TGA97875.1 RNA-binding transcriptional accessory protein [Sporolactobacillus shoreae]
MSDVFLHIAKETGIGARQVERVIRLLEKDNTIPFVARYRKEMTGGLDEVQIGAINDAYTYSCQLGKRKDEVLKRIDEQGKLDESLKKKIQNAEKLQDVEDLYLPFRQKRRTRAAVAREKGLEPLADWLMKLPVASVSGEAAQYISAEKGVGSVEDAIQGAQDIIAERVADIAELRALARRETFGKAVLQVKAGKNKSLDEKKIYEMYYDYQEPVKRIAPHRILALNRGEKEEILKISVTSPDEKILPAIKQFLSRGRRTSALEILNAGAEDAYKRLIAPAIERELRQALTEKAEKQAIHIFSENLRGLLLQPPMKAKTVLGVDPAYRTGCKLAVVDPTGRVLEIGLIFPTPPKSDIAAARKTVLSLINKYDIDMIAIGNGTASRETEAFISDTIKEVTERAVFYVIVNEAGASVYSASALAREEFPDFHVEERSAVSIARRLQDPLAELVKVDPKSVGVGEYQHDVSQRELEASLGFVVETVVNRVGVNANTASPELLQYVAGLSKTAARNLVAERNKRGKFENRKQLKDVPRLGPRAFEQCAGFLRIEGGSEPLDNTPIHPESYSVTKKLLLKAGCGESDLGTDTLKKKLGLLDISGTAAELSVGEPTLFDIVEALNRPGRDPRDDVKKPLLKKDVLKFEDLREGMKLEGTVRNVVDFGAFVDIGVKQDGLVHISRLSGHFVRHPLDVVRVGQIVTVWVDHVDQDKGRISLTMIDPVNQAKTV